MGIKEAALQLGFLGFAQFLPLFLLTPVAGILADRFDRRHIARAAMLLDSLIALGLALSSYYGIKSLPLLYAMGALHGTARVFVAPALGAIAPTIVPAKLIPRAIALNSMAWQGGTILGPALGGYLVQHGASIPYWTSLVLLLIASASLSFIRPLPPAASNKSGSPVQQIKDGFRFVWGERFLLGCITLDLFAVLLGGAIALLPVFARDVLHVGPEGLGQLRAAPAIGAASVAILMAWRPLSQNVGVKMLVAVAVFGAATAAFGFSRDFHLSMAILVVLGAADMISVFVRSSLIQLNTPDDMRGRVSAISGLAVSASNELGELQAGVAASILGATGAVVFGGTGAIMITLLWAWIFPQIRQARTFAPNYRKN